MKKNNVAIWAKAAIRTSRSNAHILGSSTYLRAEVDGGVKAIETVINQVIR
jgi:hypothetical protein